MDPPAPKPSLPVDYRTPGITGDLKWKTVGWLKSGSAWHRARYLLCRRQILSRTGPGSYESDEIELQVLATEADWATEILITEMPEIAGSFLRLDANRQEAAFAVTEAPGAKRVLPVNVTSLHPAPSSSGIGYRLMLAGLWLAFALVCLSMVWALFA